MRPLYQSPVFKERPDSERMDVPEDRDEQLEALKDKYVRLMAEFENYKQREKRERDRLIEAADETLIKELIEVTENFERANTLNDQGQPCDAGIKLNIARLIAILKEHGLKAYGKLDERFDPELHEALIYAPSETIQASHITKVLERGYTLKGKIIKHAKVAVASEKT